MTRERELVCFSNKGKVRELLFKMLITMKLKKCCQFHKNNVDYHYMLQAKCIIKLVTEICLQVREKVWDVFSDFGRNPDYVFS